MQQTDYKVLLADSQFLIRFALRELLKEMDNFSVIGEVKNEIELFNTLVEKTPDIIVIDYNQPESFNLETIKSIRKKYQTIDILVISSDDHKENINEVIHSGVLLSLKKI